MVEVDQIADIVTIGAADILPLLTKTVPPYTTTNTIVYGKERFVVVDPGTENPDQQAILGRYLIKRRNSGHLFIGVLLTHSHGDHVKAATFLSENFRVGIYAHKNAARHLKFPIDHALVDQEEVHL